MTPLSREEMEEAIEKARQMVASYEVMDSNRFIGRLAKGRWPASEWITRALCQHVDESAALRARVKALEEALREAHEFILNSIEEDGGQGPPDPQPPEPLTDWDRTAVTMVSYLGALLLPASPSETR